MPLFMICVPIAIAMVAAPKMLAKSAFSSILKNTRENALMATAMALSNGLALIANNFNHRSCEPFISNIAFFMRDALGKA